MASVGDTHAQLAEFANRTRDARWIRHVRVLDLLRLALDDDDFRTVANAYIRDQGWGDHENPEDDPELGNRRA